jgi:murein L,D-transpeptidase YcbB/YkuD
MKHLFYILGLVLTALVLSCEAKAPIDAPPKPSNETRVYVEGLIQGLAEDLMDQAEAQATGQEIKILLDVEAQRSWRARLGGGIKYADLFQEIYDERDYRKAFAHSSGLRPRGEAILGTLLSSERHALDPAPYHVERIHELSTLLAAQSAKTPPDLLINGAEAEAIVKWIDGESLTPNDEKTYKRLIKTIVGVENVPSPAPRLTALLAAYKGDFSKSARNSAELEIRVADGALRYARDMKHFNVARLSWKDLSDAGGSKNVIYERLHSTFKQLSASPDAAQVLNELAPKHPQYALLIDALARYQKIDAAGGWGNVSAVSLALGVKGPRVAQLRKRLEIEGYLEATSEDKNTVDDLLITALEAFEVAHQFRPSDKPPAAVWRSLNVPVGRRIEQIVVTVQRWRESRYEGEPDFVFVNIPDFHAEVFSKGVRDLRFRVVVGNTIKTCNAKTQKWVMPNATPVQMAQMDHLIINPFWSVPERIVEEELRPKFKNDPDWLANNNYEVVTVKGGNTWIRQKPGDSNALGRVKFIFPNRHNTYMHDTPNKKYFEYPVRAFSHGCVRVKDPMNFAHYLLNKEDLATPADVDVLLKDMTQRKFNLKTLLPVFFEYYVVRVNDEGHTEFLSDIYKLDQLRADPASNACVHRVRAPIESEDTDEDGDTSEPTDVSGDLGP